MASTSRPVYLLPGCVLNSKMVLMHSRRLPRLEQPWLALFSIPLGMNCHASQIAAEFLCHFLQFYNPAVIAERTVCNPGAPEFKVQSVDLSKCKTILEPCCQLPCDYPE